MLYTLEFFGLLAVLFSWAASPVLIGVIDRFFSPNDDDGRAAPGQGLISAASSDRAETRDEILRVTRLLVSGRLDSRHSPLGAGEDLRVVRRS